MELDQKVIGRTAELSSHGKAKNGMTVMVAVGQGQVVPVLVVVLVVLLISYQLPQRDAPSRNHGS